MNIFSSIMLIGASIGLLACGTIAASALANYHTKQKIMSNLKQHVSRLRLAKMLRYLGVPVQAYFSVVPQDTIEEHIKNCNRCSNSPTVETCDHCLQDGKVTRDMHFCPNYQSLLNNNFRFVKRHH